jgi:hypothetical protein
MPIFTGVCARATVTGAVKTAASKTFLSIPSSQERAGVWAARTEFVGSSVFEITYHLLATAA